MPTMKQFTARYDVRANTIRRWSQTFAEYLSDDAKPPKGKTRKYSLDDADVIDLIATMRADDAQTGEILNALAAGKRGQWPRDDASSPEDAPGSTQSELTGKDKLIAELSHRVGFLEGKLELMTALHDEWQERAEIAESKLMLLEAPKPPQDDDKQQTETLEPAPQDDSQPGFWARLGSIFNRDK